MPRALRDAPLILVGLLLVLTLAGIWFGVYERIAEERRHAVEQAERQTAALALALEEQTVRTLRGIDQMLRLLVREYQRKDMAADHAGVVRTAHFDPEYIVDFGMIDAAGRLRLAYGRPAPLTDVSDREYFQFHRDYRSDRMHIGHPIVGRVSGKTFVHMSRRIDAPDGSFAGLVMAGVSPEYLTRFYGHMSGHGNGLATLVGLDGIALSRRTGEAVSHSEDMRGSRLLQLSRDKDSGTYLTRGRLDGVMRYQSYRVLRDYPLIVAVGLAEDGVMAEARQVQRDVTFMGLAASVFAILAAIGAIVGIRRQRRMHHLLAEREAEERRLRHAAEDSERHKSAVVESAMDAIVALRPDGTIVEFNAAAERTFGCDRADVIGRRFGELFVPPELLDRHYAVLRAHADAGPASRFSRRFETMAQRLDGATFPVEASIARVYGADPPLVTAFIREITERQRTEAALRDSELRFKSVARATIDALWDWKLEAGTLWWSDNTRSLFGYQVDEIGTDLEWWSSRIHDEDRDRILKKLEQTLHHGTAETYADEYRFRRADGGYAHVYDRASILRDAQGRALRMIGGMTDMTARKQAEFESESLHEQLRQSQKMEAIGRLAGGVAHDFNNILSAILGNLELAMAEARPRGGLRHSLEEIRKASHRARDIVQQILSFSRRQPTQPRVVSLARIVGDSVRLLRATLPGRVQIHCEFDSSNPLVSADAVQIGQVVINLGVNAADALHGRAGRIDIRIEPRGDSHVAMMVEDRGHGMTADVRERIFEPFFTTKPVGEGTGLGLPVVHGIVTAHGGRIEVESTPGAGSRFTVLLPRSWDEPSENPEPAPARPAAVPRSVLYLDDDVALVVLMKRLLERSGHRVEAFARQDEALEMLRRDPAAFDLVVTDYNMPGMSGLDVAQAVRRLAPSLPVAMASGYITDELTAAAHAVGVSRVIFKPQFMEDFSAFLETLGAPCAAA